MKSLCYVNYYSLYVNITTCSQVWGIKMYTSLGGGHYCVGKVKVLVPKSCLSLCDHMDCSLPGSSVYGISQARILEWVTIPFYRRSTWPRDQTQVSCIAGVFFTVWATREALLLCLSQYIFWRRKWPPTPVFLHGKSHGWRSFASHSLWGHKDHCLCHDWVPSLHFTVHVKLWGGVV